LGAPASILGAFEADGVPETSQGPQAPDRLSDEVASTVGPHAVPTSVMTDPR